MAEVVREEVAAGRTPVEGQEPTRRESGWPLVERETETQKQRREEGCCGRAVGH